MYEKKYIIASHHLSELLHYDPSQKKADALKKGLKDYEFLLKATSRALQCFQECDFEKFDSLVGENACQIRAIRIAFIASNKKNNFDELKLRSIKCLELLEKLTSPEKIDFMLQQNYSLKDLIISKELDVRLTEDEMFLVQSYLLSEMKECNSEGEFFQSLFRAEKCSPSNLQQKFPDISYTFFNKLAKKLRELLSKSSVNYVRNIASELRDPTLNAMVAKEFEIEHNSLACLPAFWSFKTVLSLAQREKIPLVIHAKFLSQLEFGYRVIDEEYIYFKPCEYTNNYVESQPNAEDLETSACFIQGVVCPKNGQHISKSRWKKTLTQNSILDLLLSVGADHRQYPGKDQAVHHFGLEMMKYKSMAQKIGVSLCNPTTFFAQHIYCSQVGRKIPNVIECTNSFSSKAHVP